MENNTLLRPIHLTMDKKTANGLSPLVLAYVGDGVFDLYIRTYIIASQKGNVNRLHRATTGFVKAPAQALAIRTILPFLTEEEQGIYKRGRNQKSHTAAKNASLMDYRASTGFEALIGWLYLTAQFDRLEQLIMMILEVIEQSEEDK